MSMEQITAQLDQAALDDPVRQLCTDPDVLIDSWQVAPIAYGNVSPGSRGLYRVAGKARSEDRSRDWSLVLKVFVPPADLALDDPAQPFFWRRESLAYRSGLLPDPDAGFAAPRCVGVTERSDRQVWLWLEDLGRDESERWSLERFGMAAQQLGQFQGAFLVDRSLPSEPWLSRGVIRAWVADSAPQIERLARPDVWDLPLLRPFASTDVAAVLQLWAERDRWFGALERSPRTLCHHDLWRNNLFARRATSGDEQTIAIDWELAGLGAAGEDLGNLLGVSLLNFDVPAESAPELAELLIDRYLRGLHDAGWRGDADQVRFAAATAATLRCVFSTAGWPVSVALNPDRYVAETEQRWGRPIAEIVAQWAATTRFLLDLITPWRHRLD